MSGYIPYGAYWSSPFCRWQGALAHLHAFELARQAAEQALATRDIDLASLDAGVLRMTVPQRGSFYGLPWLAGMLGAPHMAGPTVSQACATGARILSLASGEVAQGAGAVLVLAADRVSNGPQITYPDPHAPGGGGAQETWVLDNFCRDPFAGLAMVATAENVAAEAGITTAEQHELVLRRYAQYEDALAGDRAFQRRYMVAPLRVPGPGRRAPQIEVDGDQGVQAATLEGLARLRPLAKEGTVTHGGQTHPADGAAGIVVASRVQAAEMSRDPTIPIEILAFGQARAALGHMPAARSRPRARRWSARGWASGTSPRSRVTTPSSSTTSPSPAPSGSTRSSG